MDRRPEHHCDCDKAKPWRVVLAGTAIGATVISMPVIAQETTLQYKCTVIGDQLIQINVLNNLGCQPCLNMAHRAPFSACKIDL